MRLFTGVFGLLVLACGDSGSQAAGGEAAQGGGGGGTAADEGGHAQGGSSGELVGAFQITMKAPEGEAALTAVSGKLYDGPSPENIVWEVESTAEGCVLSTPRVPYCSPACEGGSVCVENDQCQAYPTAYSAGVVTLTGLATEAGDTSFEMSPIANTYQAPAGTVLAYPPFAEGDPVTLNAAGDYFAAFSLEARGIAPIALTTDEAIPIDGETGAVLAWTPPDDSSLATVRIKLDISHHGGSTGKIECEVDDDGDFTIPPAMVGDLLALGASGYPTVVVSRVAVGAGEIETGRVELVITSSVERAVAIEGLVSCTDDVDCPDGQTCQVDLSCG